MDARILLVEDDNTTRQLLASVLIDAGYQVTTAANGTEALQLLEQESFDVVVTDIRMREIDGIEVLSAARNIRFPPEVILLTGYGSLETAVAALRCGAFNYLLKPCLSAELLECVESAAVRRLRERRRIAALQVIAQEFAPYPREEAMAAIAPGAPHGRELGAPRPEPRSLQVGELRLDLFQHTATFAARPLSLTPIEYAFLCCLAETPGRVQRYTEIVRRTHGYLANDAEAQVLLRWHVRNLRRKIPHEYLITVRSTGYLLVDPEHTAIVLE